MDSFSLFSSPPRKSPKNFIERQVSRSGGDKERVRKGNWPEYRNLSHNSRAARNNEQPWRKRFREQCFERLSKARDQSFMLRRQLSQLSQNREPLPSSQCLQSNQEHEMHKEMSEHEMYAIIQQEWARFKAEMEQQSMEYGLLDAGIIEDIEDDLGHSRCSGGFGQNINAGADGQDMDCQMREYIEWEEYENQILEDDILDEEMRQLCIDMDTDPDMDLLYSSENTNSRHQNTTSMQ